MAGNRNRLRRKIVCATSTLPSWPTTQIWSVTPIATSKIFLILFIFFMLQQVASQYNTWTKQQKHKTIGYILEMVAINDALPLKSRRMR